MRLNMKYNVLNQLASRLGFVLAKVIKNCNISIRSFKYYKLELA